MARPKQTYTGRELRVLKALAHTSACGRMLTRQQIKEETGLRHVTEVLGSPRNGGRGLRGSRGLLARGLVAVSYFEGDRKFYFFLTAPGRRVLKQQRATS